jgi:hypothetical protein
VGIPLSWSGGTSKLARVLLVLSRYPYQIWRGGGTTLGVGGIYSISELEWVHGPRYCMPVQSSMVCETRRETAPYRKLTARRVSLLCSEQVSGTLVAASIRPLSTVQGDISTGV